LLPTPNSSNRHGLLIVFVPVFNGRQPGSSFKDCPERFCIRIAYIIHDFIDIFPAGLEVFFAGTMDTLTDKFEKDWLLYYEKKQQAGKIEP